MVQERGSQRGQPLRLLAVVPSLALLIGLFWAGVGIALARAFGIYPAFGLTEPTLRFFQEALGDEQFLPSLSLTGRVAALSTLLSCVAGTTIAVAAALFTRPSRRLRIAMQFPLYLPHLVAANMVLVVFGQSGLLARAMYALGLIADATEAPALVYDELGIGIVLGFALKETPFVAVLVYPFALAALEIYGKAARTLGAGTVAVVRRIVLPMTWPAVATASVIVFAYGFSSFEVPYVLGRTYPKTLSNLAYDLYTNVDPASRPVAMALAMVIVAINLALALAYFAASRRYEGVLAQIRAGKAA